MNKQVIYTNKDNQDFTILPYIPTAYGAVGEEKNVVLNIANGCNQLYFLDKYEVDEFCKILQEVKKEVWGD